MRTKQFGTLPLLVLAAILITTIVVGLGVIFFLDKSMIAKTVSQAETRKNAVIEPKLATDSTNTPPTLGAAEDTKAIKKALEASEQ